MIPAWTMSGIVPPIRPGLPGHDVDRSPYHAELDEFISRFALSSERVRILQGLMRYRADLRASGIVDGFQWLNGSFLEHIEDTESRPPNDIDVVTFFNLPNGHTQRSFLPTVMHLFDTDACKLRYFVDGYPQVLGEPHDKARVRQTSYWYSMWSHLRDGTWKGFVQVDLDPRLDATCNTLLQQAAVRWGP